MAKDESGENKVTQSFYIKKVNRDWLKQKAINETTIEKRVTDDALLDEFLDELRAADTDKPVKQKKSAARVDSVPLAA